MQINYDTIPDLMFLPATLTRDIRKASVITIKEREAGEPDIVLESPLGFSDTVYRKDFVNIFKYRDGRRIKLGAWKKNDGNLVVAGCEDSMYAMFLPSDYLLDVPTTDGMRALNPGTIDSRGVYLICPSDDYGQVDRQQVYILSPKFFRKMFKMSGSIQDNAKKCDILQRKLSNKRMRQEDLSAQDNSVFSLTEPSVQDSIQENLWNEPSIKKVEVDNKATKPKIPVDMEAKPSIKRYTVVARVVSNGKNIGFEMVDSDGLLGRFTKREIMDLARSKRINNVGIRIKNHTEYLYGIDIRLSDLPNVE